MLAKIYKTCSRTERKISCRYGLNLEIGCVVSSQGSALVPCGSLPLAEFTLFLEKGGRRKIFQGMVVMVFRY